MAAKGLALGRTHGNGTLQAGDTASEFDRSTMKSSYVDHTPVRGNETDFDHDTEYADEEGRRLSAEIKRLVQCSREGQLDQRGDALGFSGVHREIVAGVNEMLDAILLPIAEGNRILAQISAGKIDELITAQYKGDHEKMKVAVNHVGSVVQKLHGELNRLVQASRDGQLSERGKPEIFEGAFADLMKGINEMLDAIIQPLNFSADYVEQSAPATFPSRSPTTTTETSTRLRTTSTGASTASMHWWPMPGYWRRLGSMGSSTYVPTPASTRATTRR